MIGRVVVALLLAVLPAQTIADTPPSAAPPVEIDVVASTPLPGLGVPLKDVPGNVQLITVDDPALRDAAELGTALARTSASSVAGGGQGNPFQPEFSFRGYLASPLLGTPQGLSVFQDGVRVNEPFGDAVNWDLVPLVALANIELVPGTSPAFGLNTLGGAIALRTKSGFDGQGAVAHATGGSYGRGTLALEYATHDERRALYASAERAVESGWREHASSHVARLFAKGEQRYDRGRLTIATTVADNRLEGAQTLPLSWLDDPHQAYTWPDENRNRLASITLGGSHALAGRGVLEGTLYARRERLENTSSNVNDAEGEARTAVPEAFNERSSIEQDGAGASLQGTWSFGVADQFVAGASADFGSAGFTQDSQPASFGSDRGTVAAGPFERATDARTTTRYLGLYASVLHHLSPTLTLTAAARYNDARVTLEDRSGNAPRLNGSHGFGRLVPALGLNLNPSHALTLYAAYSEGLRAPTAIELACAAPDAPCRLPNNFLADPPLAAVVSRTAEAGVRGHLGEHVRYGAAVYRSDATDDIQFVSAGSAANAGYFTNVGRTRREGFEATLTVRGNSVDVALRAGVVDARFETPFTVRSPNHSGADASGDIAVEAGDRIPSIPRASGTLSIEWRAAERVEFGASLTGATSQFARGDESNDDASGTVPGYGIVGFDARVRVSPNVALTFAVENVFDRAYAIAGVIGRNWFNGPDRTFERDSAAPEAFRAPGARRGAWVSLTARF